MKYLKYILTLTLLAGTIFAWYTVTNDFIKFYDTEGTILKVEDCEIPNPVTTACFYGAFAFLGAFFWSIYILLIGQDKQKKNYKFLTRFLVAGNIFAWTNFSIIAIRFIKNAEKPVLGCSGQITANPLTTPCFIGASIFLISLIISIIICCKNKKLNS